MLDASSPFPVSADEQAAGVPAIFVPATEEDWELALQDPWWRLTSGQLYQIMVKGDDDEEDSPGHVAPFIPNVNQLEFLKTIHDRSVITKARQLGFTTLIAIMWLDHALFVPDQRCLLIAHKLDDAKKIFRDKIKFAYDRLPEPLREKMPTEKLSADEMLFAHNNSSLAVSTSARSGTIHRLHICLSGDTEILLKDGCTKLIRDIEPGDMVMTGSGAYQPATALIKNRIEDIGEPMLRLDVHGWHAPLKLTANHQILTREFKTGKPVWKEAGEVERGDYIAFPVREASMKLRDGCLPFGTEGRRIPVSRDLGELVGMYLAEGYSRRAETTFALHRGEEVSRFCALLDEFSEYFTSRRIYDCRDSKTTQVIVNGADFAGFLTRFFGGGDNGDKRIPDAVWGYGRQFLDGLIWGYFQGDGCFNNPREVQVTSIRPQLIHQMRMLLTSLRFGVPSVYHRPAGRYYGRDCKATWVLKLHGAANWKFRDRFGLPQDEPTTRIGKLRQQMGRNTVERKNWRRGADYYWLRIKSVEIAEDEPFVYDIAMPRSPHNYVTVCGVVHNSEMGKIAVRDPGKAVEIVTGSLPAVPKSGWAFIESTAEGTDGEFYRIAKAAEDRWRAKQEERPGVWAFRFYPWFKEPGYRMDPRDYPISPEMHAYFDAVEAEMDATIDLEQRAWYIWKRDFEFSGDPEKMHREMPSTPEECWMTSNEGTWYAQQLARARAEGRIGKVPLVTGVPINTFWDIGNSDGTAIWLHQQVGMVHRFPFFIEGWEEPYAHFIAELEKRGHVWGAHFLPHDATQERQGERSTISPLIMLRNLRPGWDWRVVPRVHDLQHGIQTTRQNFPQAWFDAEGCAAGLDRLTNYRKRWNRMLGRYVDEPVKSDGNSEGADAFRQWAQALEHKMLTPRALVQDKDDPLAIPRRRKQGRRVSGLTA